MFILFDDNLIDEKFFPIISKYVKKKWIHLHRVIYKTGQENFQDKSLRVPPIYNVIQIKDLPYKNKLIFKSLK